MKSNYIKQIYEEGLGANIYLPINSVINQVSVKKVRKMLALVWKIFYAIIAVLIAVSLFFFTFPL